jgi:hypothetical protein
VIAHVVVRRRGVLARLDLGNGLAPLLKQLNRDEPKPAAARDKQDNRAGLIVMRERNDCSADPGDERRSDRREPTESRLREFSGAGDEHRGGDR